MDARNGKRFTVIVLGLLTIIIGVIAIIVATQLQQTQAPIDSSAGNTCRGATVNEAGAAGNGIACINRAANQSFTGVDGTTQVQCQPGSDNGIPNYDTCFLRATGGGGGTLKCPNDPSKTVVGCVAYTCPNGDTSGDGQCTAADSNVTISGFSLGACTQRPCGQVDAYSGTNQGSGGNNGDYCGYVHLNINCGASSSSAPARGICTNLARTPAAEDQTFPAGTSFSLVSSFTNCSQVNENMRLFVFKGTNGGGNSEINAANLVTTLTPTSTTGPGSNNRCIYNFTWNGAATDSARYKFRVGRLGANGGLDLERLETDSSCVNRADITVAGQSVCGGVCGSNGNLCPNNHTCSSNVCVLDQCLSAPASCQADKCTPVVSTTSGPGIIPTTGLFDEDGRPLLIGLILIIIGLAFNRLNASVNWLGSVTEQSLMPVVVSKPKPRNHDNSGFEKKLLRSKKK